MPKSQAKIALSVSRDIPFNRLVLSQANVRRIKAGVAIEELAEDIARRTLLQSLTVRPVLDDSGAETGIYEIPAGGRRYQALELLVVSRRRQAGVAHVVLDVEALVVDPHRVVLDRDARDPLPVARDQVQPRHHVAAHAVDVDSALGLETAALAAGFPATCVFVNDNVDEATLDVLARGGTRIVATRMRPAG